MLAMVVNDNAGCLRPRVVLAFLASMLAPTESGEVRAGRGYMNKMEYEAE